MAGYQVGDVCYPTTTLAIAAYAARIPTSPVEIAAGCIGYPNVSTGQVAGAVTFSWARLSGSCTMPAQAHVSVVPPPCAQYDMYDAAGMSWLVAGAWIASFAVAVILKRALA